MSETYTLQNDFLRIQIHQTGAELCSIRLLSNDKDYLWNANPDIWASHSPVLFPIIGNLKEGSFLFDGRHYSLPKHGFVRNNPDMELLAFSNDSLTIGLKSNPKTLEQYPFNFEFRITYTLLNNRIVVSHEISNPGEDDLFFSLGAHPAFRCPLDESEVYSDYFLEFEQTETAYTYPILHSGLMGEKTDLVLDHSNMLPLHRHLFDKDALVFKDLRSKKVSLNSRCSGKRIEVSFDGFPYLGIWAKPNADFVCIEPWIGIADPEDSDQNFRNKEGIVRLEGKGCFRASYSIDVF